MIRVRKPLQSEVFTFLSLVPTGEEYYIRGTLSAGAETLQREYFAIRDVVRKKRDYVGIYPCQRQNLLPTLEISNQNFQNFHNNPNFRKKFF